MNILLYNGQEINQRQDGYVNASQIAKANKVRVADWTENDATQKYLKALQQSIYAKKGINEEIYEVRGFGAEKAVWIHPLAALAFAQWISPEFQLWCNEHIKTLIETGKTELTSQFVLTNHTVFDYANLAERLGLSNDCHVNELLREALIDELSLKQGKTALPSDRKEYTIVKVRAKELGYTLDAIGSGSALGNYVAKRLTYAEKKRVGNYNVKHYEINEALDSTIKEYFSTKLTRVK